MTNTPRTSEQEPNRFRFGTTERLVLDLVELGDRLLPGSSRAYRADIWVILRRDSERTLKETRLAIENVLVQLGGARFLGCTSVEVQDGMSTGYLVEYQREQSLYLKQTRQAIRRFMRKFSDQTLRRTGERTGMAIAPGDSPRGALVSRDQLKGLLASFPTFNFDLLSLLANLIHHANLTGDSYLRKICLDAFAEHCVLIGTLELEQDVIDELAIAIERTIIRV